MIKLIVKKTIHIIIAVTAICAILAVVYAFGAVEPSGTSKFIIETLIIIIIIITYEWSAFSALPNIKQFKKNFYYDAPLLPLIFIIAMLIFFIFPMIFD